MGTGDVEDPREKEALREEARVDLGRFNSDRVRLLFYAGMVDAERAAALENYLNEYDEQMIEDAKEQGLSEVLENTAIKVAISHEMEPPQIQGAKYFGLSGKIIDTPTFDKRREHYYSIYPDPIFAMDEISRLRTVGFIFREATGREHTLAEGARLVARALSAQYEEEGLSIPPALEKRPKLVDRKRTKNKLDIFLEKFPEPERLWEKLMGLKDGKLPV